MNRKNYKEEREKVSRLIYMLLTDKIPVREAVLSFPKDIKDPSIQAAYHALIHREADENFRMQDLNYKNEQDEYLELIAETFQKGDPLPKNIIKSYDKYYKDTLLPNSKSMKGLIKRLCRFLNV